MWEWVAKMKASEVIILHAHTKYIKKFLLPYSFFPLHPFLVHVDAEHIRKMNTTFSFILCQMIKARNQSFVSWKLNMFI